MSTRMDRLLLWMLCAMPFLLACGRAPADIGVVVLAVLLLVRSAATRDWQWLRLRDVQLLLALWVYLCAASSFTGLGYQSPLYMAAGWVRFPLFYACMRSRLRDGASVMLLARATFAAVLLVTLDSYWQYATGTSLTGRPMLGERLSGSLSNANVGNLLLKLTFPAFGVLLLHGLVHGKRAERWALAALAACVAGLIPLTGERSSTLLLLVGLAVGGTVLALRQPEMRRVMLRAVCVVLAGMALVATQSVVQQRAALLVAQISDFWSSVYGQIFTAAVTMWRAQPFFGVGLHRFHEACQPLMQAGTVTVCDIHAHNIYLQFLAETGLAGAALFLLFALWCARAWRRAWASHGGAAAPVLAGSGATLAMLLFPVIVTQNIFSNWPGALFWFSAGMAIAALHCRKEAA